MNFPARASFGPMYLKTETQDNKNSGENLFSDQIKFLLMHVINHEITILIHIFILICLGTLFLTLMSVSEFANSNFLSRFREDLDFL